MEKRKGNYEQRIAELARQVSELKQRKAELSNLMSNTQDYKKMQEIMAEYNNVSKEVEKVEKMLEERERQERERKEREKQEKEKPEREKREKEERLNKLKQRKAELSNLMSNTQDYKKIQEIIIEYNQVSEKINEALNPQQEPNPETQELILEERLHELQRRIGIMKPENFEELYNKLPQEVAEKFKNQDKLSEEEIAEIFAKINEIEHPQPELNPEPNPQPPVPTPEDTFLDKIGDWFADKWNRISNFVLFKPFKWVFKGIKAFGKKFVEIMKLKPDEMDDIAWDDVYNAEFREVKEQEAEKEDEWGFFSKKFEEMFGEVKEQEAENEEPVLPKVEAEIVEEPEPMLIPLVPDTEKKVERKSQREQLKSQKQMARDIKKILKEQEGKSYSYEGYEFQNTGSLKILQSYFSGELKIEEGAKGRLLTPQNGEYMVRLKADGRLEADLEHPLEVKFDENIAVEEDSISSGINVRVNENWRDPQKVQGYEKREKPKTKLKTKLEKIFDRGER